MTEGSARRLEWTLIGLLTLLGAVVRVWNLDRLGLTHFDEGMYAMAALWVTLPRGLAEIDPAAALYAPPGFATLVGLGYFFFGIADIVPILVSIAAGVAAPPLAALVARQCFGPGAGVAAAALAALSGPHIAFSRMALTDALFLDAWLIAMLAGGRFLKKPGAGRAVGLGLAVGLAQNVKYNGGLAGIVVAIAAGIGAIRRRDRSEILRVLGLLAAAGVIAGLMYAPWAWYVEQHVGYAKLAAHHRGYAGGLSDWPGHWNVQLAQVVALSGGRGWVAAAAAVALAGSLAAAPRRWAGFRPYLAVVVVLGMVPLAAAVEPTLPWWIGLAWAPWLLVGADVPAPARLLGVWWCVTALVTPLYHPYARLWLPLVAAGWVLAAGLMARLWPALGTAGLGVIPRRIGPRGVAGFAVVLAFLGWKAWNRADPPRPLPGLLAATDSFRRNLPEASPDPRTTDAQLLLVLARPHTSLYLVMGGTVPFQKMKGLDQLLDERRAGSWALVDSVMLRQEGDLDAALGRLLAAYEPVHEWTEALPPATLLDIAPRAAFGDTSARQSRWMLMRPKGR